MPGYRTFVICLFSMAVAVPSGHAATLRVDFVFEFLDCSAFPASECTVTGTSPRSFTVDTSVTPIKQEFDTDGIATLAQFEKVINPEVAGVFGADLVQSRNTTETGMNWFVGEFTTPSEGPGGRTLLSFNWDPGPTIDAEFINPDPSAYAFVSGSGDFLNFDANRITNVTVTLIPEPSAIVLLGMSLLGAGLLRRTR